MEQYYQLKKQYKDCILLYQIGEFYEAMGNDALLMSKALGIILTKRGGKNFCGIPVKALMTHLRRLVHDKFKVAVAEQRSKRAPNGKIEYYRVVKRIYTSGTIFEDEILEQDDANYLMAIWPTFSSSFVLAWVDITTAEVTIAITDLMNLKNYLVKIDPNEIVIPKNAYTRTFTVINRYLDRVTKHELDYDQTLALIHQQDLEIINENFAAQEKCHAILKHYFSGEIIMSFRAEYLVAITYLVGYLQYTTGSDTLKLKYPKYYQGQNYIDLTSNCIKNLEILTNPQGKYELGLLYHLDTTVTPAGKRLMKKIVLHPLKDLININQRLDLVDFFVKYPLITERFRKHMSELGDVERLVNKLFKHNYTLMDLLSLQYSFSSISNMVHDLYLILNQDSSILPILLKKLFTDSGSKFETLEALLSTSLVPSQILKGLNDNSCLKFNCNVVFNELLRMHDEFIRQVDDLEKRYQQETGMKNLKIHRNNIIGYYVEVASGNFGPQKSPHPQFLLKQHLAKTCRYGSKELDSLTEQIISNEEFIARSRQEILDDLVQNILNAYDDTVQTAKIIAMIDVAASWAEQAIRYNYVRPIVDNSHKFVIRSGRHPVVERLVPNFVANDCAFQGRHGLHLLTGPNMAGKSTYLRQVALICLMAHMGCFVPAEYAHFGIVTKVFTRLGSGDDISNGQSTFMLEMLEAAEIVNHMDGRSLVIVDELGRGTSYSDGYAIAKVTLEYLLACTQLDYIRTLNQNTQKSDTVQEDQKSNDAVEDVTEGSDDTEIDDDTVYEAGNAHQTNDDQEDIEDDDDTDDLQEDKILEETTPSENEGTDDDDDMAHDGLMDLDEIACHKDYDENEMKRILNLEHISHQNRQLNDSNYTSIATVQTDKIVNTGYTNEIPTSSTADIDANLAINHTLSKSDPKINTTSMICGSNQITSSSGYIDNINITIPSGIDSSNSTTAKLSDTVSFPHNSTENPIEQYTSSSKTTSIPDVVSSVNTSIVSIKTKQTTTTSSSVSGINPHNALVTDTNAMITYTPTPSYSRLNTDTTAATSSNLAINSESISSGSNIIASTTTPKDSTINAILKRNSIISGHDYNDIGSMADDSFAESESNYIDNSVSDDTLATPIIDPTLASVSSAENSNSGSTFQASADPQQDNNNVISSGEITTDNAKINYVTSWLPHCLFATHYLQLVQEFSSTCCTFQFLVQMQEKEYDQSFKHKLINGIASSSHGLYAAELAGFPQELLKRARTIEQEILEKIR